MVTRTHLNIKFYIHRLSRLHIVKQLKLYFVYYFIYYFLRFLFITTKFKEQSLCDIVQQGQIRP